MQPSDRQRRSARIVDPVACTREWPAFLHLLAKHKEKGDFTDPYAHKPKTMFRMFLLWYFSGSFPLSYPCLTKLVNILATLPVGTASVERSFSKMKLITLSHVYSLGWQCSIYQFSFPHLLPYSNSVSPNTFGPASTLHHPGNVHDLK